MTGLAQSLKKELKGSEIVLVSMASKSYRDRLKELVDFSMGKYEKICYITVNDPYESIAGKIGVSGKGKVFFIDCVTSTIKPPEDKPGVSFVSSPRAFTEISIALKKAMKSEKTDFAIMDSISALMVYEKSVAVLKFIHSLILTCREGTMGAAFVILKEDVDSSMLKDLTMFVDKVVEAG
jgi:hypothetical protein